MREKRCPRHRWDEQKPFLKRDSADFPRLSCPVKSLQLVLIKLLLGAYPAAGLCSGVALGEHRLPAGPSSPWSGLCQAECRGPLCV